MVTSSTTPTTITTANTNVVHQKRQCICIGFLGILCLWVFAIGGKLDKFSSEENGDSFSTNNDDNNSALRVQVTLKNAFATAATTNNLEEAATQKLNNREQQQQQQQEREDRLLRPDTMNIRGIQYPEFRYIPWCLLDDKTKVQAIAMTWNSTTWNLPGSNTELETLSFTSIMRQSNIEKSLDSSKTTIGDVMLSMGWTQSTYDCYVNHYIGYTWKELRTQTDTIIFLEALGWNESSWNGTTNPPSSQFKTWQELDFEEQQAAIALCYFEELWNSTMTITDWEEYEDITCPTVDDEEEDDDDDIDSSVENYDSNNTTTAINSGTNSTTVMMMNNETMVSTTNATLSSLSSSSSTVHSSMNDTTTSTTTTTAAQGQQPMEGSDAVLISTVELIDTSAPTETPTTAAPTETPYVGNPANRYLLWSWLFPESKVAATTLGYTEETWNQPMTASVESLVYDELNEEQIAAAKALGLAPADTWNCHINHYSSFSWEELATAGVQQPYITLGWTFESWNGLADPPATETKRYDLLTFSEQAAARQLCYRQETWDRYNLIEWVG